MCQGSKAPHRGGSILTYSHWGLIRLQPVANRSFHSCMARFLLILLRVFKSGMPFLSILPLSIRTFGFWSQLDQSYLNLKIHTPLGSFSHPSRFILRGWSLVQLYYYWWFYVQIPVQLVSRTLNGYAKRWKMINQIKLYLRFLYPCVTDEWAVMRACKNVLARRGSCLGTPSSTLVGAWANV